ncbi:MAG: DoxX family membrane protein [Patescibacteria group bacterium]
MGNKVAYHILRVGMAITFIWIGILILKSPESWAGYMQPWAVKLLPVSTKLALISTAILDITIGLLFLVDWMTWLAGLLGAFHLITVLTVSGITDITVRDIGLMAGCIVIMIESLPISFKYKFLKKINNQPD